jgi:hypothetical protein
MAALLDQPVELPSNFQGIITIYPDSHNTIQIRRYWLIPSTARIVRNPDKKLAFGLAHSGISSFDPDGIGALLNVTFQPYIDNSTLTQAKQLIEQKAIQEGATSVSFNYISPKETTAQILVGGQYIDWTGANANAVYKGGSVEAGIPFQVKLKNSFDARCLAQAGGEDGAIIGALFTMKFDGVGNRVHFKITAKFEETYKHFVARVKASGWFGLAKIDAKYEWQELKKVPGVELKIYEGTEEQIEKFQAKKIFENLLKQVTERTGIFAQTLKPSGLPDAPGGGGFLGWSVSAGGGFEEYTDKTELIVEVDAQTTREQQIVFGMNFPTGGSEMKEAQYTSKPYPTSDDFKKQIEQHKKCRTANLESLKKLRDSGAIDQATYMELVKDALAKGCYVDYTVYDPFASSFKSDLFSKVALQACSALQSEARQTLSDQRFKLSNEQNSLKDEMALLLEFTRE